MTWCTGPDFRQTMECSMPGSLEPLLTWISCFVNWLGDHWINRFLLDLQTPNVLTLFSLCPPPVRTATQGDIQRTWCLQTRRFHGCTRQTQGEVSPTWRKCSATGSGRCSWPGGMIRQLKHVDSINTLWLDRQQPRHAESNRKCNNIENVSRKWTKKTWFVERFVGINISFLFRTDKRVLQFIYSLLNWPQCHTDQKPISQIPLPKHAPARYWKTFFSNCKFSIKSHAGARCMFLGTYYFNFVNHYMSSSHADICFHRFKGRLVTYEPHRQCWLPILFMHHGFWYCVWGLTPHQSEPSRNKQWNATCIGNQSRSFCNHCRFVFSHQPWGDRDQAAHI